MKLTFTGSAGLRSGIDCQDGRSGDADGAADADEADDMGDAEDAADAEEADDMGDADDAD